MFILMAGVGDRPFNPIGIIGEIFTGRARTTAAIYSRELEIKRTRDENVKTRLMQEIAQLKEEDASWNESFSGIINYQKGKWTMMAKMGQAYASIA